MIHNYYNWLKESKLSLVLFSSMLGMIAFFIIYGFKVMDFGYDAWLLAGGDLTQHYLGWTFFRNSEWYFPIGLMDGVIYPDKISVMYTDSIPLLAIFFKLINIILPDTFQYFGLWGLLCYGIQGVTSAFIIRYFIKNNLVCVLGAIFFIFSTTVMQRLYMHTALASQWLILLAILLFLYRKDFTVKRMTILWSSIAFFSVSIHAYFVPMTLIFLFGSLIADYVEKEKLKKYLYSIPCYICSTIATLYVLGAFEEGISGSSGGLGSFGSNLNTFFSPWGFSKFLLDQPGISTDQQREGFAYLGLGMLLLSLLTFIVGCFYRKRLFNYFQMDKGNTIGLSFIVSVFAIISFLPVLSYGDHILLTIKYPELIEKILSVFRATGRFSWVLMYLIMLINIVVLLKVFRRKIAIIALVFTVTIQLLDISKIIQVKHDVFTQNIENLDYVVDDFINLKSLGIKHVTFLPRIVDGASLNLYKIAYYAEKNGLSISDFYLARKSNKNIQDKIDGKIIDIANKNLFRDEVFVINDELFFLNVEDELYFYHIDGIIFGFSEERQDLNLYRYPIDREINLMNSMYVVKGKKEDGKFIIFSDDILYGPYTSIKQGKYIIEINGSNLTEVEYDVVYDSGKKVIPTKESEHNDAKVIYETTVLERVNDVEFRVKNKSNDKVVIEKIFIQRVE